MSMRTRLTVAILVICALAGTNLVLFRATSSAEQKVASGAAAAKAARASVPKVLSYSHLTIDDDLARARKQTTGTFAKELRTLQTKVVKSAALRKQVVTKTLVVDVGVVRQGVDRVELLVFAAQLTRSKDTPTQQKTHRLSVVMEKPGDRWLVASLEPI